MKMDVFGGSARVKKETQHLVRRGMGELQDKSTNAARGFLAIFQIRPPLEIVLKHITVGLDQSHTGA
jgi:hypothetical protein